jgi:hypothetical protein
MIPIGLASKKLQRVVATDSAESLRVLVTANRQL